jgi:hypothetical protein
MVVMSELPEKGACLGGSLDAQPLQLGVHVLQRRRLLGLRSRGLSGLAGWQ